MAAAMAAMADEANAPEARQESGGTSAATEAKPAAVHHKPSVGTWLMAAPSMGTDAAEAPTDEQKTAEETKAVDEPESGVARPMLLGAAVVSAAADDSKDGLGQPTLLEADTGAAEKLDGDAARNVEVPAATETTARRHRFRAFRRIFGRFGRCVMDAE